MKQYKDEGIVIKRRNSGEADRLLTVLTRNGGKLQIKAIGVRRITSRRASHTEPLNIVSLSLYKGRAMPILTEAQTIRYFPRIKEDLARIGFAYHICELIDGLCAENQEHPAVFDLLVETLVRLDSEDDIVSVVHGFEVQLLTYLGFWPENRPQYAETTYLIEDILERRLKTRRIFQKLS